MPISRTDLEGMPEPTGRKAGISSAILEFLSNNPEEAFSNKEISEATRLNPQTVSQTLRRLHLAGKVIRGQDIATGTTYNTTKTE